MKEIFDEYVSNYDLSNSDIKLKYNHSLRVMELSKKYAKELGFNKHDIELATMIGLFHDIGRFEQLKQYNTYSDAKSIDHATYGNKILFEEGLIEKIWKNKEDYEVIRFAIENHNKLQIEETNNKRSLMHAKLIRDTDKLDIIYLEGQLEELDIRPTDDEISKDVLEQFKKHNIILRTLRKNYNDGIVITFSFVFDINNTICLEELKRNYKYFYKKVEKNNKFKYIYEEITKYINERIGRNARYKI